MMCKNYSYEKNLYAYANHLDYTVIQVISQWTNLLWLWLAEWNTKVLCQIQKQHQTKGSNLLCMEEHWDDFFCQREDEKK